MKLPRNIGPIHFIGIGGIGMSGIAEVLMNLGYTVQGSDAADSASVKRLRDKGAQVSVGHSAAALGDAEVVVVSTAIKRDNPELAAARTRRLPVVRRAEMLAELMRLKRCIAIAGTHGKTTTTSLVAALVDAGGFDPTVINGGIINAYGTNARLGAGDLMVVEADESDGTFLKLPADVAIVTNVDPEHLDHFKTFDAVQEAFRAFVENVPFYGFAVMCTDHPVVQRLVGQITDRRVVTYGENLQADVRLADLNHVDGRSCFSIVFRDRAGETAHEIKNLALPMPGRHNALNATAAIAVARELSISDDLIRTALENFGGVRRRFTRTGAWNGIPIIDDYGHHPVEIAAVLLAARESSRGQVIAVVQPHRYTRLSSLFEQFSTCFNDADTVIIAHVYAAGETPLPGADRDSLVQGLRAHGHRQVIPLDGPQDLPRLVRRLAQPGDIVVCLGAGNITQWAYALPGELAALDAVA
jgi:UDP-N-acetylmuramate--alanine ligase